MLSLAILLALLGLAALILALWQGSTLLAWVCVVIAVIGIFLFVYDWRRHHKSKK